MADFFSGDFGKSHMNIDLSYRPYVKAATWYFLTTHICEWHLLELCSAEMVHPQCSSRMVKVYGDKPSA